MSDSMADERLRLLDDAREWSSAITIEHNTQGFLRSRAARRFPAWLKAGNQEEVAAMLLVADAYLEGL